MGRLWLVFVLMSIVLSVVRAIRKAKAARTYGQGRNPWERQETAGSAGHTRVRSPYEVLGVAPGASEDEATAAYHRLVQMYHPDKVANLAPEFREVAERRMKEINAAYEELKRSSFR